MEIKLEHPFFSAKKQLFALCKPFFAKLDIRFVDYARYYHDGNCIFLSNEIELDYQILNQHLLPNLDELQLNTSPYVFLSTALALPEAAVYPDVLLKNIEISTQFNLHHRLFLVFNYETYVETFEFGIDDSKKNVPEFFMNHLKILEKFCHFFRSTAHDIVKQTEEHKEKFHNVIEPALFKAFSFKNDVAYLDLLKDIRQKKYQVKGNFGTSALSQREFECLYWNAKEKTAKQIGKILSLSPRTVEEYLCNLKNKLGCRSKFELIEVANKNPIVKAFNDTF